MLCTEDSFTLTEDLKISLIFIKLSGVTCYAYNNFKNFSWFGFRFINKSLGDRNMNIPFLK